MVKGCFAEGVRLLRAAVDELLSASLTSMSSAELAQGLQDVEVERRRLAAVDHRLLPEVAERGLAGDYGRSSPADLLVELLRLSPGEARARMAQAGELGPRREVTGAPLPPLYGEVADAARSGEISTAHMQVIARVLDRVPPHLAGAALPVAEELMVKAARAQHPGLLARTGEMLLARLDPDGREPKDDELERRRDFTLTHFADGGAMARGTLTTECAAVLQTILDALSAPRPAEEGDIPDPRSAGQRRHDALTEAGMRLLRSGSLPPSGGVPVTIMARVSMTELQAGVGVAQTGHGEFISVAALLAMAAEAQIVPVVCTDTGGVLAFGRAHRLATCEQRLVLAARDGGCVFPGCDRPPTWCEAHHVVAWQHGGATDLDNMCLLCSFHHRCFEAAGWVIQMRDHVPVCIPPPWIDPRQQPRRNTARHLADIDFASVVA